MASMEYVETPVGKNELATLRMELVTLDPCFICGEDSGLHG